MAEPRGNVPSASIRSIMCRWPMKLIFSMPGVPSATPAQENRAWTGPPSWSSAWSIEPLSARLTWMNLAPSSEGSAMSMNHHLGAGVLRQLGRGRPHARGATHHERTLALVPECVEHTHIHCLLACRCRQAMTPRTLRSTMVSQSIPRSERTLSPCSLNSGARLGTAGTPPNWTGADTSW